MTKQELLDVLKTLCFGGQYYSIVDCYEGVFKVYDATDSFTGIFISDAIQMAGDAFSGITVDCDGRPYMLFSY